MKTTWSRHQPIIHLNISQLTHLVRHAIPDVNIHAFECVHSGLVNTLYRITLTHTDQPLCLRICQRETHIATLEHTLAQQLALHLPIPPPIALITHHPSTQHPCTLTPWVPGTRLDILFNTLNAHQCTQLAQHLGTLLATLHQQHHFDNTGTLHINATGDLTIAEPFDIDGTGLITFAQQCLLEGHGKHRLPTAFTRQWLAWLDDHASLLDNAPTPCLCHGDFGTENLLLEPRPSNKIWILDWEFACAATPLLDLGHLLRTPLGDIRTFENALAQGYLDGGGTLPHQWALKARLMDSFAWLSFLDREYLSQEVVAHARRHFEHLMATQP